MPLDRLFLQYYDENYGSMRTIATATQSECRKLDLLSPLSEKSRGSVGLKNLPDNKDVLVFEDPDKYSISREMLQFHDVLCTSLMVMLLKSHKNTTQWIGLVKGMK